MGGDRDIGIMGVGDERGWRKWANELKSCHPLDGCLTNWWAQHKAEDVKRRKKLQIQEDIDKLLTQLQELD